ncbi:MAG: ATP-binding cassette domain-containing protein [Clostridia bacterium]|nr:ATP-binding cassette domain-containing protein [Clostridia bacterium]
MQSELMKLSNVSLAYHTVAGETAAIQNLNLSVLDGEFLAIVGPSGCGKTTVLSLIMGLLPPTEGSVRFSREDLRLGYMLQRDHLLDHRTVEKNVLLGLEVQHRLTEESKARAFALLDTYGLGEFRAYKPQQLSGGMRQKVALIRTLALEPDLLLLDEPFSALDYQTRLNLSDEVYRIIRSERKSAILVTHDISEAVSMADRVAVFSARPARLKEVIAIGFPKRMPPLERRSQPAFHDYFDRIWKELQP